MTDANLERLLAAAGPRDRPADEVWPAAAAAIELLFWHDRFHEATELTLGILQDFADRPGDLIDQDIPFDLALLAGVYAGDDPAELVTTARGLVSPESLLGKRLGWLGDNLPVRGVHALLGDKPETDPQPFRRPEQALADRDPVELTTAECSRLWNACSSRNQYPTAKRLWEATGEPPSRWPAAVWLAGHLVRDGEHARAASMLIEVLPWWIPYEAWDIVPTDVVLRQQLRQIVTPEFRVAVLASTDISRVPGVAG